MIASNNQYSSRNSSLKNKILHIVDEQIRKSNLFRKQSIFETVMSAVVWVPVLPFVMCSGESHFIARIHSDEFNFHSLICTEKHSLIETICLGCQWTRFFGTRTIWYSYQIPNITFSSIRTIRMSYFAKIPPKFATIVTFLDFLFVVFAVFASIRIYSHYSQVFAPFAVFGEWLKKIVVRVLAPIFRCAEREVSLVRFYFIALKQRIYWTGAARWCCIHVCDFIA